MGLKEDLENDIRQFFNQTEDMLPEHKGKALMLLFDKYLHLNASPLLFKGVDFSMILDHARRGYLDKAFPKKIRGGYSREVTGQEAVNLCIIEATIGYLSSKDCLKRKPRFDYE